VTGLLAEPRGTQPDADRLGGRGGKFDPGRRVVRGGLSRLEASLEDQKRAKELVGLGSGSFPEGDPRNVALPKKQKAVAPVVEQAFAQ